MDCPSINDSNVPSFCIMIPTFKRNYFSTSLTLFSNQTSNPKFYVIIQNENRINFNISLIQKILKRPVYHIWMQNWNSFFFLNHRLSSVFPCNFILKYDDDQWPLDNTLHQKLINFVKGNNIILGHRGYSIPNTFCGYSPKNILEIEKNIVDHIATPMIIRTGYLKLDARNKIYRLYGAEDIALSLNSWKCCNVTSKLFNMSLIQNHKDGKNHRADKQIIAAYKSEKDNKFDLFINTYCFLIHSGYTPRRWAEFQIPRNESLNILIKHKRLK